MSPLPTGWRLRAGALSAAGTAVAAALRPGSSRLRRLAAIALVGVPAVLVLAVVGGGEGWAWAWPVVFLRDLALVGAVAVSAWGIGGTVAGCWRPGLDADEDRLARIAVGLGVLGLAVLALGLVGWLSRPAVTLVVAAGLLLGGTRFILDSEPPQPRPTERRGRAEVVARLSVVLVAAVALCGSVVPESFYDALYYHTAFPAHFLRLGRIVVFPHAVHSAMPSHVDLCYVPLVAWGGASTVKLGHFALYCGVLAWIAALGRRLWGRPGGVWAAAILAAVPGMGVMAGLGGIDLGVTFFAAGCVTLTVAGVSAGVLHRPILLAAAFLAGVAAGSKYSALLFVFVWAVAVAAMLLWCRPRRMALAGGLAVLVMLGGGGWYLRNLVVLGNPLYPALAAPSSEAARVEANLRADSASPGGWLDAPRALLEAIAERRPMGAGAELLPGVLLVVAGVVWALGRAGPGRWLAVIVVLMGLAWSRSLLIVRYAYPVLVVGAAVAAGILVSSRTRSGWRRALAAVAIVLAGLGAVRLAAVIDVVHQHPWRFLAGQQSAATFLAERLPHFEAARWVAAHTPERATRLLLVGETQGYYFARDYEPVSAYDRHPLVAWAEASAGAADLDTRVRQLGFTHVVLNRSELQRLNRAYGHFVLSERAARVVAEWLAGCPVEWSGNGVQIYRLGR
ncbi:MAG: hypothetical protein AB2L07_18595 [Thermoanaerobaculaceae bacterium]